MIISNKPLFIGLAGTLNAGKDSLGVGLAERHGFLHKSTSDMIRQMKREKYGADSPKALLLRNDPFINELRKNNKPSLLMDAVYAEWQKHKDEYPSGFVGSAMRAIGEAEMIQSIGGINIFVDADPKLRYERSQARLRDANEQGKTFEEFIANERTEVDVDPTDKTIQNLPAMREMADIVIYNDGNDIEQFKDESIEQIKRYLKDNNLAS